VLFTDLKNIWEYCSKINMQQNTYFKFYIDALYLIVTEAENMPSMATVWSSASLTPYRSADIFQFSLQII